MEVITQLFDVDRLSRADAYAEYLESLIAADQCGCKETFHWNEEGGFMMVLLRDKKGQHRVASLNHLEIDSGDAGRALAAKENWKRVHGRYTKVPLTHDGGLPEDWDDDEESDIEIVESILDKWANPRLMVRVNGVAKSNHSLTAEDMQTLATKMKQVSEMGNKFAQIFQEVLQRQQG